ncbi:hypothetical protein [Microbacterium sp.]|uniref:hypothetical protein n=1 Tax=Microbacterium sp. TaxID=51671 RepID=UPI00289B8014|nr:hypothetical protein [Microbacterium sp.]
MRALLLGGRGAVGSVIRRELTREGHRVTVAGRSDTEGHRIDLRGDLRSVPRIAADHDVVVNASGVERADLAGAVAGVPLVDISATGSYLEELRRTASGPVVLGAGLAPGLSTVLVAGLHASAGDELDVFVMLGTGEKHGPAAVDWTAGLVGTDLHRPPEGARVRNLRESRRAVGPDGRSRRYLRADFPDHVLLEHSRSSIRTYLTLGSAAMTASLELVGRMPALRGLLASAPHIGSDAWHVIAQNRRSGARLQASGRGQSLATGRLTALAAVRAVGAKDDVMTMADLVTVDEAMEVLRR